MAIEVPAWAKKKVGPLPVGGWVLLVGGGIGVVLYIRKKRAGESGDMVTGFNENEGDDVYGVPIDSPAEEYAPWTPAPAVVGAPGTGGWVYTPPVLAPEPGEDVTPEELPVATVTPEECTKPHQRPNYAAEGRPCPNGWHIANPGTRCAGWCIPNVG